VLFSTLQLHQLAAALVHESARQQGIAGWKRNWLPIALFGTVAIILMPPSAVFAPRARRARQGCRA
jgi:hypothetical protein